MLGQEVARPRVGPPFEWRDGAWRLTFARPEVDRLEYLLASTGASCPIRRTRCARAARSATSRSSSGPSTSLPRGSTRSPTQARSRSSSSAAAASSRACACCLYATPDPPGARRAADRRARRAGVRATTSALTRFLDAMSWEERIPPLRAALIQPVDRNETYSASALYAACARARAAAGDRAARAARRAHRDGREPRRRSRCCTRTSPSEAVRRPAPPVGQLLPPALRQAGVALPALPADHALRRHRAARASKRARPIPVAITCGTAEENRANNEDRRRRSDRAGLPGVARRWSATRTTGRAGATRSTRTCPR